jgi:proteasome lid subunit RPN8/RPN11
MAIRLSEYQLRRIRDHARRDYPYECCGIMIGKPSNGDKIVSALRPLKNVHEEGHERRYSISPEDMFKVEREARQLGLSVVGFYHSHPDHPARPSEYDRVHAWPWYSFIIVSVMSGRAVKTTSWVLEEDRSKFNEERIETSPSGDAEGE